MQRQVLLKNIKDKVASAPNSPVGSPRSPDHSPRYPSLPNSPVTTRQASLQESNESENSLDSLKASIAKKTELAKSGDWSERFHDPRSASSVNEHYSFFKQSFNRDGDVVYGMARPRADYIKGALGSEAMALGNGAPTADARNRWIVPANELDAKIEIPGNIASYHAFLLNHNKVKFRELAKREVTSAALRTKKITHSCKALIEATAKSGNTVHFLLDDGNHAWDMEAVAKKDIRKKAATLITAKELRYIFKNRNLALHDNTQLSAHILFWKNGQKVSAPWVSDPELWSKANFCSLKKGS